MKEASCNHKRAIIYRYCDREITECADCCEVWVNKYSLWKRYWLKKQLIAWYGKKGAETFEEIERKGFDRQDLEIAVDRSLGVQNEVL